MSEYVTWQRRGRIGHILLDRPKALNALDAGMCEAVHEAVDAFAADPGVEAVVVTSSGKHFCAGGDIKAVRAEVVDGHPERARAYFETEYPMNQAIADLAKPYVAVLHGATMGGGLGVSMHGSHRVVTETLVSAMPETAIGFIPDVGASWVLPRLCGGGRRGLAVATYLGLSGARMDAADALYTGLATHFLADDRRAELLAALESDPLEVVLERLCSDPSEAGRSAIAAHLDRIEEVFSGGTVAEMRARLRPEEDGWEAETAEALDSMSPTSMVTTRALFERGAAAPDLAHCLRDELETGTWMCAQPDFVEGVRAVLVDKTHDAHWSS